MELTFMYQDLITKKKSISVIGLGYVGLPLALEFAKHFKVIGFDINPKRVEMMKNGIDPSKELESSAFDNADIHFTCDAEDLKLAHFHIIGVPTDIDQHKVPNLTPLKKASESVGKAIKKGDYVVYESTVYPGCTEEDCLPILEQFSGLKAGVDFKYGYSPERINPGDKERTLTKILKIVSGNDATSLDEIAKIYGHIIEPGVFKAKSVKVAEAAKVIENTQRDINIALMNELAMIFDRMGIDTQDVLEAAGTKWNFLKFFPGLVGGHCIGVDPYYLAYKAQQLGFMPKMIPSGRGTNEDVPSFIAKRLVQKLLEKGKNPSQSKVLVMGITFKEDVSDIRNSKVVELIRELMDYSIHVQITDPNASPNEIAHEYKLSLTEKPDSDYDAIIVAVAHKAFKTLTMPALKSMMKDSAIVFDLKGVLTPESDVEYWRL
jgi:UDP-N-acetyl-D-glucosamine/UDP-N-acetyl-D-galactosamine dehydrogenase